MTDLQLSPGQLANAQTIVGVGKRRGFTDTDITTAITVALAESNLQNYANYNVPESLQIPHDSVGQDHNSVGVFQQQVGIWGSAVELMDTVTSANKFYDALDKVPNRSALTIPQVAQTVQKSAFSDGSNYAKQLDMAKQITGTVQGNPNENYTSGSKTIPVDPIKWVLDPGNQKRIGLFVLGAGVIAFALVTMLKDNPTVKLAAKAVARAV